MQFAQANTKPKIAKECVFANAKNEFFIEIGKALFPESDSYEIKEKIAVYEPIAYFDINDPPFFLWHGGNDNQLFGILKKES